jgi:glycosyltransferase involved in cell wall biosynthesis
LKLGESQKLQKNEKTGLMVVTENIKYLQNKINSLSVIVPVYNCEKYVTRTLDSICQSIKFFQDNYPNSHNVEVEIVVVDDKSTDRTLSTVLAFSQDKQNLFKIVQHENNCGAGAARNTGAKHAHGEILFFCDGDDLFFPSHILVCFIGLQGKVNDIGDFQVSHNGQRLNIQLPDNPPNIIRTGVKTDKNIHPSWQPAIENSLPLNLCIKRQCHEFVEGFPEDEVYKKIGGMGRYRLSRILKLLFSHRQS